MRYACGTHGERFFFHEHEPDPFIPLHGPDVLHHHTQPDLVHTERNGMALGVPEQHRTDPLPLMSGEDIQGREIALLFLRHMDDLRIPDRRAVLFDDQPAEIGGHQQLGQFIPGVRLVEVRPQIGLGNERRIRGDPRRHVMRRMSSRSPARQERMVMSGGNSARRTEKEDGTTGRGKRDMHLECGNPRIRCKR